MVFGFFSVSSCLCLVSGEDGDADGNGEDVVEDGVFDTNVPLSVLCIRALC